MDLRAWVHRSLRNSPVAAPFVALLATAISGGCSERMTAHVVYKPVAYVEGKRSIKALGRIQPEGGVVSITGSPGTRIAKIQVREGGAVAANDELFRLDTFDVLDANCRSAEAQLEEAKELLVAEQENTAQLEKQLALEKEQLQDLDPLDIEAQGEKLKALELKLAHEEGESRRLNALREAKSSLVSEQELTAQGLLVEGARAERNGARALLQKLKAGHALGLEKLKLQQRQLPIASRKAQLSARQKSLAAALEAARRQRDQAVIRAPKDGRILKIVMHDGETIGNQPVLQMGDTRTMCIMADVSDLYIRDLKKAQGAKATAFGESLTGTINASDVGRIVGKSALPSLDPTVDADRRVVEVKIRLDEASSARAADLTNLQVDVLISLDEAATDASKASAASSARVARAER
ncbi:MAG: HlyD family efflux transporter periplasmic adaptor subunit [Isosphaeraceae bacterium]|nr:HlyD family efflux transporter periplasmic adaptor subunit [Isosphaeraceae bacterium]